MTAGLAMLLIAAVLAVALYPLRTRRTSALAAPVGSSQTELTEQYRSVLADLQDAEMDWQVGNLAEHDYLELRDQYRLRAASLLHELDTRQRQRDAIYAEIEEARLASAAANGVVAHRGAGPGRGVDRFVVAGAAAAALALAGVAALYVRAVGMQAAQAPLAALPLSHAHTVMLGEGGELWVGHHDGLLQSSDGVVWGPGAIGGDVMAVLEDGDRRWAFGHELLLESRDGGRTWTPLAHNLPGTDVHGAVRTGNGILAYVVGYGFFRSLDGARWELIAEPLAQDVGSMAVLPRPGGGDLVFVGTGGTILRSADGGRTWSSAAGAGNLAIVGFVRAITADPVAGALFAATSDGLFRSLNGGADWTRLPFRGPVAAVGARGSQIAVVDDRGGFYLSRDGGGSWLAER